MKLGLMKKTHSVSGNGINFAYMYNKNAYMYVYSRRSSLYRPIYIWKFRPFDRAPFDKITFLSMTYSTTQAITSSHQFTAESVNSTWRSAIFLQTEEVRNIRSL